MNSRPTTYFCGALHWMRHRNMHFCGASVPMRHRNKSLLWRMGLCAPQKCWFLWRTTRHAPLKVQRSINSDNRVWGPSYYCGAQMVVRHKRHHFCGARKTHAPQTSMVHYYLCATKILLWRMAYLVRHEKRIRRITSVSY